MHGSFSFYSGGITIGSLIALADALPSCPSLKAVMFVSARALGCSRRVHSSSNPPSFLGSAPPVLRHRLSDNDIRNDGAVALARALPKCPQLERLESVLHCLRLHFNSQSCH